MPKSPRRKSPAQRSASARRAASINPWMVHLKAYHMKHPNLTWKEAMVAAVPSYYNGDNYKEVAVVPYYRNEEVAVVPVHRKKRGFLDQMVCSR